MSYIKAPLGLWSTWLGGKLLSAILGTHTRLITMRAHAQFDRSSSNLIRIVTDRVMNLWRRNDFQELGRHMWGLLQTSLIIKPNTSFPCPRRMRCRTGSGSGSVGSKAPQKRASQGRPFSFQKPQLRMDLQILPHVKWHYVQHDLGYKQLKATEGNRFLATKSTRHPFHPTKARHNTNVQVCQQQELLQDTESDTRGGARRPMGCCCSSRSCLNLVKTVCINICIICI